MLGRMRSIACVAVLVALPAAAVAELAYKIIGVDGAVIYTDRPVPGAVEIKIPKPSSYAPRELPVSLQPPEPEPVVRDAYEDIRITKPEQDATVHLGEGGVDVDVLLEPPLQEGHTLTYAVDGKEAATGLRTTRVSITDLDRGTHHVDVSVRDEGGALVGRSPQVAFHVRRPSVNDPLRRDPRTGAPVQGGYKPAGPGSYGPPGAPSYVPPKPGKPPFVPAAPAGYAPSYAPNLPR